MWPSTYVWDHDEDCEVLRWVGDSWAEVEAEMDRLKIEYPEPRYTVEREYVGGGTSQGAYDHACGYHN